MKMYVLPIVLDFGKGILTKPCLTEDEPGLTFGMLTRQLGRTYHSDRKNLSIKI